MQLVNKKSGTPFDEKNSNELDKNPDLV